MKCSKHQEIEAVAACTNCGRWMCEACKVEINGRILCKDCVSSYGNFTPQAQRSSSVPINTQVNNNGGIPVRVISAIMVLYAIYSLLTTIVDTFKNIMNGAPISSLFLGLISILLFLGYIAYGALKIVKPRLTPIPLIPVAVIDFIIGVYLNITIFKYIKDFIRGLRLIRVFMSWYLLPILALILVILSLILKNEKR